MSKLNVFCTITAKNGERVPLSIESSATPSELRRQAADATKIPLSQLRLIFRGKMIKDDDASKAVEAYKLEEDCVLHCMGKPVEAPTSQVSSTSPAVSVPATSTSGVAAVPSVPAAVAPSAVAVAAAASATSTTADPLQAALQTLRSYNSPQVYSTALSTFAKILSNIADHPMEEKYRRVKQGNAAFQKRLGGLRGGDDAMKAAGFVLEEQDGATVYQLKASAEAWPKLIASKTAVEAAAQEATRALNTATTPAAAAASANNMFGNPGMPSAAVPPMGGMPPNAAAAMRDPRMRDAMQQLMGNPQALQNMLQVCTVITRTIRIQWIGCPRLSFFLCACLFLSYLTFTFFVYNRIPWFNR